MRLRRSFMTFFVVLSIPFIVFAGPANDMCKTAKIDTCKKCGFEERNTNGKITCVKGKNMYLCPCFETVPTGKVVGVCTRPNFCDTKDAPDQYGKSGGLVNMGDFMKALGPILQGVGSIMGAMKGAGGGSGAGTGAGTGSGYNGCVSYYQTSNASNTDQCGYYVPATSDSIYTDNEEIIDESTSASKGLFDSLFGTQPGSDIVDITSEEGENEPTPEDDGGVKIGEFKGIGTSGLEPGVRGDIRVIPGGITVLVGNRDVEGNKEVVGFYGAPATQSQQTGIISNWCNTRPWAKNFLSFIIPPTFFDSLCTLRGYKVGTAADTKVSVTQTKTSVPTTKTFSAPVTKTETAKPIVADVEAIVDIWAVPDRVTLGARTTVFWNAKGVETCQVTSPDGSFSHETLSGGAATVPLTSPTTYSISCVKADGKPVTSYITVQLRN